MPTYHLSIIIIFYNMCREAKRTLYSLTQTYQQNADEIPYEVIVIDNGSTEPLEQCWVESLGANFRYVYFNAHTPSPSEALNYGEKISTGKWINLCIDGARILSPGIIHYSMLATKIYKNPFIYTLGMHIGHKPQPFLVKENYSQTDEDKLINTINWEQDGYSLFDISSLALSSRAGYFSTITESNCVTMLRSTYREMGGFDEKFKSAGGGLVNLDFFNRANMINNINPVMLLGEATFHQFHGGTLTNVPTKDAPWNKLLEEYYVIRGKSFEPYAKPPTYFGNIHSKCYKLLNTV